MITWLLSRRLRRARRTKTPVGWLTSRVAARRLHRAFPHPRGIKPSRTIRKAWPALLDRVTPRTQQIPHVRFVRAVPAPTGWVITYDRVRYHHAFNHDPKTWAAVLAAGAVRFERHPTKGNRFHAHIRTRDPLAEALPAHTLPLRPDGSYSWRHGYELGKFENGSPWALRIDSGHVLVSGITGSGKTTLLQLIVGQALIDPECDVAIIDPQGGVQFSHWQPWARWFAADLQSWHELLEEVHGLMLTRYDAMRAESGIVRDWKGPRLLLIVDEIATVFADKAVAVLLDDLIRRCRAAGITIIGCTQTAHNESISTRFRAQCATRIALALASDMDSDMALSGHYSKEGVSAAKLTHGQGRALVRDPAHQWPTGARSWHVPLSRIEALVSILPLVNEHEHPADEASNIGTGISPADVRTVLVPDPELVVPRLRLVPKPAPADASQIRPRRLALSMSQAALGKLAGVSERTVRTAEQAKASDDTVRTLLGTLEQAEHDILSV